MQQPELGRRLAALRKERNLTQEDLVVKSYVSVRTIQRIEAGEVMPRLSTVKILLSALGESYESFAAKSAEVVNEKKVVSPDSVVNSVLMAATAGALYLISQIILGAMDIAWFTGDHAWGFWMNLIYTSITVVMVTSFALFARGFIVLGNVFENRLLTLVSYIFIVATAGLGVLDITSLFVGNLRGLWILYAAASLVFGALSIVFGVSLLRLQDSMGTLARVAGILEIVMGCMLATVVLFFLSYVILIPAVVIEIIVLYRGYEYLSRTDSA